MNLCINKTRAAPSRFILFPVFSLVFHFALGLFFMALEINRVPEPIREEEVIAMVDLNELFHPPAAPPPAPEPEPEPEPITKETPAEPPAPPEEAVAAAEPESSAPAVQDAPILDPELDEEPEALSEETVTAALETTGPIIAPAAPIAEADEAPPEAEPELASSPVLPEPALGESPQADASEAEPAQEEAAMNEALSAEALAAPEPTPPETLPEPLTPPSPAPALPSAQEPAKPSELQDEPKAAPEKVKVAAVNAAEIEKKVVPPPPPKPRPSKEKIKKSGLLGLLGDQPAGKAKNPLLTGGLNRTKKKSPEISEKTQLPESPGENQKIAQLRSSLLSTEKKRLMKQKSVSRRRPSQIKIVHGGGRNYGIISSAIEERRGGLTSVYNRQLLQNPNLQGNLIIEFTISPEGRVVKSQILTSSFSDPLFEKALIQAIQLWKFPSVPQGETTVLYPLSFFPASEGFHG